MTSNHNAKYIKLLNDIKSVQLDYYFEGNYCDLFNKLYNRWFVGEIVERDDDEIKVRYESSTVDLIESHLVSKDSFIAHFRKWTCCNTSPVSLEKKWRDAFLNVESLYEIKSLISIFITDQCNVEVFDTPLEIVQILRGKIYYMIHNVLTTELDEPDSDVEYVIELLCDFISFGIEYFKFFKDHIEMTELIDRCYTFFLYDKECALISALVEVVETLRKIFAMIDRCNLFYEEYTEKIIEVLKTKQKFNEDIGNSFKQMFIQGKGIVYILEIFNKKFITSCEEGNKVNEITIPLYVMNDLMMLLLDFKDELTNEDFNVICSSIEYKICNISEFELKTKEINEIDLLSSYTKTLFLGKSNNIHFGETIKLAYVLKLLISKNLPQKIKGIAVINKLSEEFDHNISNKENNDTQSQQLITKDILLSWLRENKIVEDVILGINMHEEILKRSANIFILIIKNNYFTLEILELLWKCLYEKHESISNEIKSLLIQLALHLNEDIKKELYGKLSKISLEYYTKEFVSFLRQLSINSILSSAEPDELGLQLLWNVIQQSNSLQLIEWTIESIKIIFQQCKLGKPIIVKYLIYCIENFRKESSGIQSMILFKTIIETYGNDIIEELTNLDKKYNIISIVLNDLEEYMQNRSNENQMDMSSSHLKTIFSHSINIDTRLKLIFLLYEYNTNNISNDNTIIQVKTDYLMSIWNIFILKPSNELDKNMLCRFLLNKMSNPIINKLGDYLYNNILLDPNINPPSKIFFQSMNLFLHFFYKKNTMENKLVYSGRKLRTASIKLEGFDFLWNILFQTANDKVKIMVSNLLVEMCLNPLELKEEVCKNIWETYQYKIVNTLSTAIQNKNQLTFCNIIHLIKRFILVLSQENQDIIKEDQLKKSKDSNQILFSYQAKGIKRSIPIGKDDQIWHVKEKISCYFKLTVSLFTLIINEITIKYEDDNVLLFSILQSENDIIQIIDTIHPVLTLENNPRSMIIENPQVFNSLFTLLIHQDQSYINEVNEIIYLLPHTKELSDKINECKLTDLFSTINNSIYCLSYIINLIKFKSEGDSEWTERFHMNNGTIDILTIFLHFPLDQILINSTLSYKCIEDLIFLLNNINEIYQFSQSEALRNELVLPYFELEIFQAQSQQILHQILLMMLMVFKSSLANDTKPELINKQNEFLKKIKHEANDGSGLSQDLSIGDEVCYEIKESWQNEYDALSSLMKFLDKSQKISIDQLKDNNIFKELITDCLIYPKNKRIKIFLFDWLLNNLKSIEFDLQFYILFINILFKIDIFDKVIEAPNNAEPFFQIIEIVLYKLHLTDTFIEQNGGKLEFDLHKNVNYMLHYINSLYDYPINATKDINEIVLNGFLSILKEIAQVNLTIYNNLKCQDMFDLLYFKCNFSKCSLTDDQLTSFQICKNIQSKYSAFKLLAILTINNEIFLNDLLSKLSNFFSLGYWRTKYYSDWNIIPSDNQSSTGYIGLLNLGCTCYMNSLLQQLFSIQSIREGILQSADLEMYPLQTSLLFHLKILFASLLFSENKYHNPKHFTNVFQNYEGSPMNTFEQMDVDEFFNLFLERLEGHFPNGKNPIKAEFKGVFVNELICQGCPHSSSTSEVFNSINLQVKNKNDLLKSLDSFFTSEILEGDNAYYCSECKAKIPTIKSQKIKELPSTLVIVLKRFEFDYNKMIKIKVNDYCEFPFELDMKSYSKSKSDADTLYSLRGFIIHKGTAESGHYVSVIYDKAKNMWIEFNDTKVVSYNQRQIAIDGYGSINDESNNTNAYVLFYEKKNLLNNIQMSNICSLENIQPDISTIIKNDNQKNAINKMLFSNEFSEFIQDITINYSNQSSKQFKLPLITKNDNIHIYPLNRDINLINSSNLPENAYLSAPYEINEDYTIRYSSIIFRFYANFLLSLGLRVKDRSMIPRLIDIMKALLNNNVDHCKWILGQFSNLEVISEFLIDCCVQDMKVFAVGILNCAMIQISKTNIREPIMKNFISICLFIISKKHIDFLQKDLSMIYIMLYRYSQIGQEAIEHLNELNMLYLIEMFYSTKYKLTDMSGITMTYKYVEILKPQNELIPKALSKNEPNLSDTIYEKNMIASSQYENTSGLILLMCRLLINDQRKLRIFKTSKIIKAFLMNSNDRLCMIYFNEVINMIIKTDDTLIISNFISAFIEHFDMTEDTDISFTIYLFNNLMVHSGDGLPNTLKEYMNIILSNTNYYMITLCHIKNLIYLWHFHKEQLHPHKNIMQNTIENLMLWLSANPYPPQYFPSKSCLMYKKINIDYSKINVNALHYQVFMENYKKVTNNFKEMLSNILTDKDVTIPIDLPSYYNLQDYSHYKFSSKDKITINGVDCIVLFVMDEMLYVEYKDGNNKNDIQKWLPVELAIVSQTKAN